MKKKYKSGFKVWGEEQPPEYSVWTTAKNRCNNPRNKDYARYGGRGIKMCSDWENSFLKFYEHMGSRPDGYTLDRINPNGNYEPGNCRWASRKEQANNFEITEAIKSKHKRWYLMHKSGMTQLQIGKKCGVRKETISLGIRRHKERNGIVEKTINYHQKNSGQFKTKKR